MMKNKGSNPDKIKSESQLMMRGLCSEPSFDSFCSILIFEMSEIWTQDRQEVRP